MSSCFSRQRVLDRHITQLRKWCNWPHCNNVADRKSWQGSTRRRCSTAAQLLLFPVRRPLAPCRPCPPPSTRSRPAVCVSDHSPTAPSARRSRVSHLICKVVFDCLQTLCGSYFIAIKYISSRTCTVCSLYCYTLKHVLFFAYISRFEIKLAFRHAA